MPTEEPKLTDEERARIAELEKSRALSDAELLKGGAEYVVDEKGEKVLVVTDGLTSKIKEEIERGMNFNSVEEFINYKGIKVGDLVEVTYKNVMFPEQPDLVEQGILEKVDGNMITVKPSSEMVFDNGTKYGGYTFINVVTGIRRVTE